jgi:tRNA nucleotidyltransferase (CCA-adding enzyme)
MGPLELEVLRKIKPHASEEEAVGKFAKKVLEAAEIIAKPFLAYPEIVGSTAKGTYLKHDYDFDLFIVFRDKIPKARLEEFGLLIGTSLTEELGGTYNLKYAEHPYVRAKVGKYSLDIVPCYAIKNGEKIISAVDRSPLHTKYVSSKLKGVMKDHARLMKYFCKRSGIYGADAKAEGLSGYLCELFIIEYGTFSEAIKNIAELPFRSYIDPEGLSSEKDAKKAFKDALIVIDPTDKNRNVAAPLSPQNFLRLKIEAKKCIEAGKFPSLKSAPKNLLINKLKEDRGTYFYGICFEPPDIIAENLYPQLRKLERRVASYLGENDFSIVRHHSWTDESENAYIIVEVEKRALSKYKRVAGPTINSGEIDNFLEKYLGNKYKPYIEGGQFFVCAKRRYLTVETALRTFLKERREEIPKRIAEMDIRVLEEKEIIDIVNRDKALNSSLARRIFSV